MKITIEATPNEIKELLQAIGGSKEQLNEKVIENENFVYKFGDLGFIFTKNQK